MDAPDTFTDEVILPETVEELVARLQCLFEVRRKQHKKHRAGHIRRKAPRGKAREDVLNKTGDERTGRRCHICGGLIDKRWQADHVLAHSGGGQDSPENYLPAHSLCNHYRSDYLSEEFQWILKMGVWARTLMQNSSSKGGLGQDMVQRFFRHEKDRISRRKSVPLSFAQDNAATAIKS